MLAIKKTLSYITITSLLFSNVVSAGKDLLPEGQDWEHPLTTIRPNTFSSTREIDALHIYESGEIIAQDVEGNQSSIKPYNQPQEIRDAIAHGHLSSLLGHFNLYVTKPGEELKIQLMGGLKGGMRRGGRDPTTKCMSFDRPGGNNITVCFPCYNGCGSNTGSPSQGYGGCAHSGHGGGGGRTYQDEYGSSWQLHAASHYASICADNMRREEAETQHRECLSHTLEYHKLNNVPAYKSLTSDEEQTVLSYAFYLCSQGLCNHDTGALKQAIKQVVYDTPAHHVLGWYQSLSDPGVQFYKNLSKKHSQQIIETAKELAYGQGNKPDSATITQAYDKVMTGELRYIFDYHKQTTKALDYQDLPPEYEATLLQEALGGMKSRHGEFKEPDTAPLTESFRYHRTLGEALLKGYGQSVDELLCATLGSCKTHANYFKLGQKVAEGLISNGPQVISMADKGWRWLATSIGLSSMTQWNGKVKSWITVGVDWIRPHILRTPVEDMLVKISILETWGPEETKRILSTPKSEQLAIKLVTGTYEGPNANILNREVPFAKDQLPHIFKDEDGHLKKDTPENRQKLWDAVEPENLAWTDKWGKDRYAKTTEDGKQTWVHVINGKIMNGGVNDEPRTPTRV